MKTKSHWFWTCYLQNTRRTFHPWKCWPHSESVTTWWFCWSCKFSFRRTNSDLHSAGLIKKQDDRNSLKLPRQSTSYKFRHWQVSPTCGIHSFPFPFYTSPSPASLSVYMAEFRKIPKPVRFSRRQYEPKLADYLKFNPRRFFAHVRPTRHLKQEKVARPQKKIEF